MKNLLSLILITFLFISCTQNDIIDQETVNVEQTKIDQVTSLKNRAERKIAYSLLDKSEKFTLWEQKLDYIINSQTLSKKQISLISEIKKELSHSLFEEDSDESEYFKTIHAKNYLNKLKKEFTINEIGQIFYSVKIHRTYETYDLGAVIEEDDGNNGGGTRICSCNKNSMVSCRWLNSRSCKDIECKPPTIVNQCGFFMRYPCNGVCKAF